MIEGPLVAGGDSDLGHVVRGNTVTDTMAPPDPWTTNWRTSRNFNNSIQIGFVDSDASGVNGNQTGCFQDIVVEDNRIVLRRGNGTCA